jgi:hypothetical protein
MIYTSLWVMLLMRAASITLAGPKKHEIFGPLMALAYLLDAISQGPKTLDFQGAQLPSTCPCNEKVKNDGRQSKKFILPLSLKINL